MKKFLCLLLSVSMFFALTACSSSPVAFSEKLLNNQACFIDVVEITPQSYVDDVVYLYCQCTLEDGSVVWMEILPQDYIDYFDAEADEDDINFTARKVVYEDSVRINGKVANIKNILDDSNSKKIKVFHFTDADESVTLENGTREIAAVEFDESIKSNTVVYTDIVRIESKYGVSALNYSSPDHVICQCQTKSGESVWLYISVNDYHEFLDASALFKIDYIDPSNAETLEFVYAVRLYGIAVKSADKFNKTFQGAEIPSQIIEFKNADKEQIKNSKISNQAPVKYSGTEKANQQVYIDITHITPYYVLYSGYTVPTSLICKCKTTDGNQVWIIIGIANYEKSFFDDYEDNMQVEKALQSTTRIIGRIEEAKSVSPDLSSTINQDFIVSFTKISAK